jgi:hypothetical protein
MSQPKKHKVPDGQQCQECRHRPAVEYMQGKHWCRECLCPERNHDAERYQMAYGRKGSRFPVEEAP